MAIYKLQHCYSLLSSPAEKLLCARLMQWRHRAEGDRRGKPRVPHEPQRADSEAEAFFGCTRVTRQKERRRAAITPLNADSVVKRVQFCHNFHRPTQVFGDFGDFVM
jgi:hypothetical protein